MDLSTLELKILTLNVWGIPYVSKNREERIQAIGTELTTGKYDVVSLQEVWSENDYQLLKKMTEVILPFSYYFYSGVIGSGLCIFSKYPIISAFYHQWSVNGYVHRIQHGDWFGGKGVGLCKINVNGKIIHVYSAHLHAEYNRNSDDYLAHRVIQAFDTAQFIENTRGSSILQILAGDLNTEPGDLAYRVLLTSSQLTDAFIKGNVNRGTNGCSENSYSPLDSVNKSTYGKRIDYIMYRAGFKYETEILEYNYPLPDKVPGKKFSYSDHEAVYSKIKIYKLNSVELNKRKINELNLINTSKQNGGNSIDLNKTDMNLNDEDVENNYTSMTDKLNALKESIKICDESLVKLASGRKIYFSMAFGVLSLLFFLIDVSPLPYGLKSFYLLLKILLSGLILFFIFMGTIWNVMERHGIMAGKNSMAVSLKSIEQIIYNNHANLL